MKTSKSNWSASGIHRLPMDRFIPAPAAVCRADEASHFPFSRRPETGVEGVLAEFLVSSGNAVAAGSRLTDAAFGPNRMNPNH